MKLFVAISQPDGDWDHHATIIGVFSTRKKAEAHKHVYSRDGFHVEECEVDQLAPKLQEILERCKV